MAKLSKTNYRTARGEVKLNCYNVNISKEVVSKTNIGPDDKVKIYAKNNKIIIEKVSE